MDLLINKEGLAIRLSQLGLYNIAISESSPALELDSRKVRGRSGKILADAVFVEKQYGFQQDYHASALKTLKQKR